MLRSLLLALAASIAALPALAQSSPGWQFNYIPPPAEWNTLWGSKVDRSGGTLTNGTMSGGSITGTDASGANVTPTGAPSSATTAALAAQQGVLLDTFKANGDADDTAAMTRAVAAGVPILLGPKTYTVNNFSTGAVANFILRGVKGQSIIQRTSAANSAFLQIGATKVIIDGVIFDSNKASVTANQWGMLINTGGQTVSVTNSVFKNNSGSLASCFALINPTGSLAGGSFTFSNNEVTGCGFSSALFGSVQNGLIGQNYVHDNQGFGIFVGSYLTATSTNYAYDVRIVSNEVNNNAQGIQIGGVGVPYVYGTPASIKVSAIGNHLRDNTGYDLIAQGDYSSLIGNRIDQSATSPVSHTGAIDCNARYTVVEDNTVTLQSGVSFGIDCGSGVNNLVMGNHVTMVGGLGINTSASINSTYSFNVVNISGAGTAIDVDATDTDGSGYAFPLVTSGTSVADNTINITTSGTQGIVVANNAGGYPGTTRTSVRRNKFNISGSGTSAGQAIVWYGAANSLDIGDNTYNSTNVAFVDPNGNGDVLFDNVFYGGTIYGISATTAVRSVAPGTVSTYGLGGSVLWTYPSAGGSGYVAATTTMAFSGTGCTAQNATPLINQGVIVGVRMNNFGSGCSGTVTAAATDTGGGTGATFVVGTVPTLPAYAKMTLASASNHLLQRNGGIISLQSSAPYVMNNSSFMNLQSTIAGTAWGVVAYSTPQLTTALLTTIGCTSTSSGAAAMATDALTPTYGGTLAGSGAVLTPVLCNGTNWITH